MDSHKVGKRLKLALFLTFFVMCVEVVGGILSNSLALLSDAAHMFADVFALGLSLAALKIATQPSTSTKTFGYHRMEIFAAFINGSFLVLMAGGIIFEAVERFNNPQEVETPILMAVAAIGFITNLGVIYFLKEPADQNHDLNIKSAFYHVLGDTLASLAVIIGGAVMWFTGWYALDSFIAVGIAMLILWGAVRIIGESVHILLEGVPRGVSLQEVKNELTSLPAIRDIHELHIWCICSNIYALSVHALINDQRIQQTESLLDEIRQVLKNKFNITHSTIQIESSPCLDSKGLCEIKH